MRTMLVAGGGLATWGLATSGRAQTAPAKAQKQDVQYQDHPMDIRMCATCTLFEAPNSCKVVEGEVSKKGWCALFALVD